MVGEVGVQLFSLLTARKLLIPGTATTAKKAPLPDPLYVNCTKSVRTLIESNAFTGRVSHNLQFFEEGIASSEYPRALS